MQDHQKKKNIWQIVKFVLISISAGIIQIASFTLMKEVFHWANWISYLISLILSVVWNFTINRKYTFRSNANVGKAMLKVFFYYLVFTPLSTWWTAALTGENPFTGAEAANPLINPYLLLFLTMVVNMVTEFLFQRFVVYRNSVDTNEAAQKAENQNRK